MFLFYLGNGWVGWRKESFSKGFVELVFEFSEVRNFSAVHIFTNNFFSKNVQVSCFMKFSECCFIYYYLKYTSELFHFVLQRGIFIINPKTSENLPAMA